MPNLACASHKQNKFCSGGPAAPAGAGAAGPALLALAGDTPQPDIIGGGPANTAPGEGGGAAPDIGGRLTGLCPLSEAA